MVHRHWLWAALLGLMLLAGCNQTALYQPAQPPRVRIVETPLVEIAVVPGTPSATGTPISAAEGNDLLNREPRLLYTGQHISASGSYTDNETEAAGPMACRIEHGSCAFRQLALNRDPMIYWSGSEPPPYDIEDNMMHPDMAIVLDRLKWLVEAEWGGETRMMVTEAYDSLLEHDIAQRDPDRKYSLHFEGRSIDLIPWPPDLEKMARLCALAHHAGFDWVHNEQDHCHASVRAWSLCTVCSWRVED